LPFVEGKAVNQGTAAELRVWSGGALL